MDALPLAVEAYNGSIHAGLSRKGITFSPAETWLGRKIRFNADVRPTLHDRPTDVQEYGEWVRQHTEAVKEWIRQADEAYRQTLVTASSSKSKLRKLKVGDTVVLRVHDLKTREKNAGAERWEGPWEIVELGEMPTDYLIKRQGSRQKPRQAHIDNLKQKFSSAEEDSQLQELSAEQLMKPAKDSDISYEVEAIVGEKGRGRSSKYYLIKYEGYEDAWWQTSKN